MRHSADCQCDACSTDDDTRKLRRDEIRAAIETKEERVKKACQMLEFLGIPTDSLFGQVNVLDLYNILMDKEKVEELVKKLKLKAFW